ncbi:mRNA-binding ribosome synthesis protein nop7, partial [Aspergillus brasiliensis]
GQDIMWLVPYRFVQRVNGDVDYRIMATFVDFYTTLLGFVNYRLYSTLGLRYPPKFDKRSDENGAELAAFTLEGRTVGETPKALEANKASKSSNQEVSKEVQAKVDKVIKTAGLDQTKDEQVTETTEEVSDAIDKFEPTAPEADTLPQPDLSGEEAGSLFAPFVFYVSREAPKAPLEFILRAFGCSRIGWDAVLGDGAFTHDETDTRITHQIVDRPSLPEGSLPAVPAASTDGAAQKVRPGTRIPGRTYVQPQWVWDCVNEGKLLRADLYAPGATLPPHLSPWVKPSKGGYDPRASLAEQEEEGEAELDDDSDEEMEEATDEKKAEAKEEESEAESEEDSDINGGMDVAETDEDESESEEEDEDFGGFEDNEAASESEDEEEAARTQHQKELEAEAAGLPFSSGGGAGEAAKKKSAQAKKIASKKRKEEEELERQKMMMSRKKRKLLEKMMYSNKQKSDEAAKLRSKRRKLEKEGQK